jgi:spore maturation protein CgeB
MIENSFIDMRILIVDPGFEYSTLAVAESYTRAFESCGYEVMEYNLLSAMKEAQRGKNSRDLLEITEFACAPILRHVINDGIDFVFVIHGYYMNPEIVLSLRRIGCKICLILTDDPMQIDVSKKWSSIYDFVFTNEKNTVKIHKNCFYLPVAVDKNLFDAKVNEKYLVHYTYKSDILFAGSMYKERVDFIDNSPSLQELMMNHNTIIVGSSKLKFKNKEINKMVVANRISYEQMAKYTIGSKICIDVPRNEFRDGIFGDSNSGSILASCLSPRIFEAALAKSLPVSTRHRSEINELFPEELIPCFDNEKELCCIIDHYLNDEVLWLKTVDKIYCHCKDNHTYDHRVRTIEKMIDLKPSKKVVIGSIANEKVIDKYENNWKENFTYCQTHGLYTSKSNIENERQEQSKKAIIVSNGASMMSKTFQINESDGIKFAVNNSLRLMGRADYVVVIHPDEDVYERCFKNLSEYSIKKTCLIASSTANKEVIRLWELHNKERILFFNPSDKEEIRKQICDFNKYPIVPVGCTVGYSAIAIALYLGFKEIEIYGLDLCYLDGYRYAFMQLKLEDAKRQLIATENMDKKLVLTDDVMLKTKEGILDLIKRNPDVTFKVYGRGILYCESLGNLKNEV